MKNYEVMKIINSWDPIELLDMAPLDEYSYEIDRICSIINKQKFTINTLADDIYIIFSEGFGDVFTKSKDECLEIAAKIIDLIG